MIVRAAALLVAVVLSLPARAEVEIERVSFTARSDGHGYVVRLHASGHVPAYSVDRNGRDVELVLFQAQLAPDLRRDRAAGPVRTYRLEADDDRVVIHFRVDRELEVQAYTDRDSNDLLLTLADAPPSRAVAWGAAPRESSRQPSVARQPTSRQTALPQPDVRQSEAEPQTVRPQEPVAEVREASSSETGPRRWPTRRQEEAPVERIRPIQTRPAEPSPAPISAASVPPISVPTPPPATGTAAEARPVVTGGDHWRLDTIVLDAGHGGGDHGAVANGTSDKEVALSVVRRLGPMIERELGVRVVYTRDDDTFYELNERGRIANRAGGKLFISVHANAAASSSARGTETFFLAPRRSESAREVMERENSVIQMESDPSLYEDFDDEGDILRAMAMSAYQEESQTLAALIEGEFEASGRHSRGVKQAPFIVLWAASMPAVLVEAGFITNPEEARLLKSDAGLQATAESIFRAVRAYKERYERGLRLASDL